MFRYWCFTSVFIALFVFPCSAENLEGRSIIGKWILTDIVNADGSSNSFTDESNSYVEIQEDYVVEIIADFGKRRYNYTKIGNDFHLEVGAIWKIRKQKNAEELQIETPIGVYNLKRKVK